jgi:hypothetical protein
VEAAGSRAAHWVREPLVSTPEEILLRPVHASGADQSFGALSLDDVRAHAAELAAAAGWGPTARVATVARAWRELADAMAAAGAATVADLGADRAAAFGERLWVVPPGGALLR